VPARDSTPLVPLGVVIGAHGLRGELRVKPYNPSSELLLSLASARVRLPGERGDGRERGLRRARRHGPGLVLTLEGCDDRDAAEALRGAELCVPRSALPPLDEGEHYLFDLVGLEARLPDGQVVGRVEEALEYPASHALRVTGPRGTLEVPLLEPYVVELRPDEGFVIVDQLEDLEPLRGE
jgi:16S rRNA processing protein RimM